MIPLFRPELTGIQDGAAFHNACLALKQNYSTAWNGFNESVIIGLQCLESFIHMNAESDRIRVTYHQEGNAVKLGFSHESSSGDSLSPMHLLDGNQPVVYAQSAQEKQNYQAGLKQALINQTPSSTNTDSYFLLREELESLIDYFNQNQYEEVYIQFANLDLPSFLNNIPVQYHHRVWLENDNAHGHFINFWMPSPGSMAIFDINHLCPAMCP